MVKLDVIPRFVNDKKFLDSIDETAAEEAASPG